MVGLVCREARGPSWRYGFKEVIPSSLPEPDWRRIAHTCSLERRNEREEGAGRWAVVVVVEGW
ncbi:hypothetical protein E2C01_015539 [Portunus trituberculatus]|uniref:Uncharacterized protein n=1 Tax=Portunus trituberculatus TaxID=210409 RepID=A0A5B7DLU1_PORTR|nr:hypothetical protein [Portunus trituberculatus]